LSKFGADPRAITESQTDSIPNGLLLYVTAAAFSIEYIAV